MEKRTLVIITVVLSVLGLIGYAFWPSAKDGGGVVGSMPQFGGAGGGYGAKNASSGNSLENASIISYAKTGGGADKIRGVYQIRDGKRVFVPSTIDVNSVNALGNEHTVYQFASGQKVEYNTYEIVKIKPKGKGPLDFEFPSNPDSKKKGRQGDNLSPFSMSGMPITGSKSQEASSQCLAVLSYIQNAAGKLERMEFDIKFSQVLSQMERIAGFGGFKAQTKADFVMEAIEYLQSSSGKIDINAMCSKILAPKDYVVENAIFKQCIAVMQNLLSTKNANVDFVLSKLQTGIDGFTIINPSQQMQVATEVANALYNYTKDSSVGFDANYFCSMITSLISGFLKSTEVFAKCVLTLQSIEKSYASNKLLNETFIMNKLMEIPGFAFVSYDKRSGFVSAILADLKDDGRLDVETHCLNITAAIYAAISDTDLFKQCIGIMNEIQQLPNPSLADIDVKLQKISGFALLANSVKQKLILAVKTDIDNGDDFNPNLHCFNIVSAILDAIGSSELFKQCMSAMANIQSSYTSQSKASGFNVETFKSNVILTQLHTIDAFGLLSNNAQTKFVEEIYKDLTDGGDFNAHLHCTNIVLALAEAITSSPLYQKCLTIMDEIVASGKRDSPYIEQKLNELTGFAILSQDKKTKFINDIVADLNNGGDFKKEQHCLAIVAAIFDAIQNSALYKKCVILIGKIDDHFDKNNLTSVDKYQYIDTMLSAELTGFKELSLTKKEQLINNIVTDYNTDGNIDAVARCLEIVLAILENKTNNIVEGNCKAVVGDIIKNKKHTDTSHNTTILKPFFGNSQQVAQTKANELALYQQSQDVIAFTTSFCSPADPTSAITKVSCIEAVQKLADNDQREAIEASADKPGYVNGFLAANVVGYVSNTKIVSLALNYAVNAKGNPNEICSGTNLNPTPDVTTPPSGGGGSKTQTFPASATTVTCVTEVKALTSLSTPPQMEFVTAKLRSIDDLSDIPATEIAKRSQSIMSHYSTGNIVEPTEICKVNESSSLNTLSAEGLLLTQPDVDASCKAIISNVSRQVAIYQVDSAQLSSTDPGEIANQQKALRKSYVGKVLNDVDGGDHLAPISLKPYLKDLLEIHVTGLGVNYSQKKVNVLNQTTKSKFVSYLYDNFDMVKNTGAESRVFAISEIGKCINPLRKKEDIEYIFKIINAKEGGVTLDTDRNFSDTYELVEKSRKTQHYQQCFNVVDEISENNSVETASNTLKNVVNGAQKIGDGFVGKIAQKMICYHKVCKDGTKIANIPSDCSDVKLSCNGENDKTNICDEYSSAVFTTIPNADIDGKSYAQMSYCEPTDLEYLNYAQELLVDSQTRFIERMNQISSIVVANTSETDNVKKQENNNSVALNYIAMNLIFDSVSFEGLNFGMLKFSDINDKFTDNNYTYTQFKDEYFKILGLVDSSGNILTEAASLNNSILFASCVGVLSFTYSAAENADKLSDLSFIANDLKKQITAKNGGITSFGYLLSGEQVAYRNQMSPFIASAVINQSVLHKFESSNPCYGLANRMFVLANENLKFNGSISVTSTKNSTSKNVNVADITADSINLSSIISNADKKDLKSSDFEITDVNFNAVTNTAVASGDGNIEKNRFMLTKTSDFVNAGLSEYLDSDLKAMSYNDKKAKIAEMQSAIVEEIIIANEMFDMEGKQRLCKTILEVWNATIKNNGNPIDVEKCSSLLISNWSDGACNSDDVNSLVDVCGSHGPGIRKVSTGEACFNTTENSGLDFLSQKAQEREAKRSYYERLLDPPTNKCKCYIEKIYRMLENGRIDTYELCISSSNSYLTRLRTIFDGHQQDEGAVFSYGSSVINSPRNDVCKMVYSQINEIMNDTSETTKIEAGFVNNEDYKTFAKQICIQRLRDLFSTIEYVRKSYWMDANINSSTGVVMKPSEFTKWQNSSLESCDQEPEDYL